MSSPSPNQSPKYDYEEIQRCLRLNWTGQQITDNKIANPRSRTRRNVERWYERETDRRRKMAFVAETNVGSQATNRPSKKVDDKETRTIEEIQKLTDIQIIRIKYGELPPTNHISKLNNDDWIDEYIVYDYFTYDPEAIAELKLEWRTEYLTNLRNKIWTLDEILALLPRGYGKTESVLALFVRWILEILDPLYIVGPSYNHQKNILRRIVRLLKGPAIRRRYGDIFSAVSYDREMLTLTYHESLNYNQFDPPVSLTTWQGAKEGPHPAWMHFDDCWQKEFKNIESNEDIRIKYSKVFSKMRIRRGGKRTRVSFTGTRYAPEDAYSYLMTKQKFPFIHEKALGDNDKMLKCPNYTLDDLLKERDIDPAIFETSMNNNPVPSTGVYFKAEHWKTIETNILEHEQGAQYFLVMDPGKGFSDFAARTAILVVAIWEGKAYVVDGYVGRIDADQSLKYINAFYTKYNPAWTLIEKTYAQVDMRRFAHLRGLVPYSDTVKRAKLIRISAMKSYFVDGLIYVLEGIQPYKFLYREFLAYKETDSTPTRKDDAIDALSMIIQQFGKFLSIFTETNVDWSESPDFHLTA